MVTISDTHFVLDLPENLTTNDTYVK